MMRELEYNMFYDKKNAPKQLLLRPDIDRSLEEVERGGGKAGKC